MAAKSATLAVAVAFGFSFSATAEDAKTYQTIQVSCSSFKNSNLDKCDSSSLSSAESDNQTVAQSRGGRRGIRSKGNVDGYYGGFSLGIGFPNGSIEFSDADPDAEYTNGFVGSIFGGIKFSRNFSTDLEFMLALGGLDTDELNDFVNDPINGFGLSDYESDGDYSALAVYLNPKFELPLTETDRFSLYISPGIGIAQTNVNFNAEDDQEGVLVDRDGSNTGFTYQVKGGASYSFNRRTGVFGQLRYASISADEDVDDINIFSVETGLKLTF